ncbi:MAG: hypothetical protein IPM06_19890 [Rhizobiales bacterium]|nr:hypothetical protein [Hyphomicrobiales bacterium]
MYPVERRRNWPGMIIIVAVLGFICLSVWWMTANFGATFAMAVCGSLLGATLLGFGVMLNQRNTETTLGNAADFNRSIAMTEKARQGTYREGARLERDAFNARARLQVIDERRVDQMAQQRAKMLTMNQSQLPTEKTPAWLLEDESEEVDARWYE